MVSGYSNRAHISYIWINRSQEWFPVKRNMRIYSSDAQEYCRDSGCGTVFLDIPVGNSPRMPGIPSSGGEALADPELEVFLASEDLFRVESPRNTTKKPNYANLKTSVHCIK